MNAAQRPTLMYVLGLAPQKIGGIEKFLRLFVLTLDRAGWNTVLCFDGPISEEFREFIDHPSVSVESLHHQGNLGFSCAGELWRLLRRHRPDRFIYAFHGVMRCFPWLARLGGCTRIFFNDHSSRQPGMKAAPLSLPKRIVGRLLTAPLTAIISVSEFTRRTGTAFGITSAPNIVVWNGVEVREPDPARRQSFRQQHGLPQDAVVITQVCWMIAVKGVGTMLDAAAALLPQNPDVRIVFVGGGPQLEEYRAAAEARGFGQRVVFTGMLNHPTDAGVFDATDIYCQPSIWQEAIGLAVLEAMSTAVPVVASDSGGLPEVVKDGATGFLFPTGDPVALADRLGRLTDDSALRSRFGQAGRERVLAHHQLLNTVTRYAEIVLA